MTYRDKWLDSEIEFVDEGNKVANRRPNISTISLRWDAKVTPSRVDLCPAGLSRKLSKCAGIRDAMQTTFLLSLLRDKIAVDDPV
jgi:hypothetical protein